MPRWLKALLVLMAAAMLAQLLLSGWFRWQREQHRPVRGEVLAVSQACWIEETHYGSRSPTTTRSAEMDCDEARERAPNGRVVTVRSLTWRYVSPVDGRTYQGSGRSTAEALAGVGPGDPVEVLAHRSEAGRSRLP